MTSRRKRAASRRNGRLSRGPLTPDGKRRASLNALRHGFAARSVVVTAENAERYQQILEAFIHRFQPADESETLLVERMAAAEWRLRRLWSVETALLDYEMDILSPHLAAASPNLDTDTVLALGFRNLLDHSSTGAALPRYEARFSREYTRAYILLRSLQDRRQNLPAGIEIQISENLPNEPTARPAPLQITDAEPVTAAAEDISRDDL